jgi:hypothetical protein
LRPSQPNVCSVSLLVVTSQGSPYARFRRALETKNLSIITAAASEVQVVHLADALRICLVIEETGAPTLDAACVRWLGRFCLESDSVELTEVVEAARALQRLGWGQRRAALDALERVCRPYGIRL